MNLQLLDARQKGFTLIELLVVIAIIGILAAIAIPLFSAYRTSAFNSSVVSDMRNAIVSEEAYYVDNSTYVSCTGAANCESILPEFRPTLDYNAISVMSTFAFTGTAESFTASAQHRSSPHLYTYDSTVGDITQN